MQENKNAEQQAEDIISAGLTRNDYFALWNLAERAWVTLSVLKPYQTRGLQNLTGVNLDGLLDEIADVLKHVETPYDDIDDTEPPRVPKSA